MTVMTPDTAYAVRDALSFFQLSLALAVVVIIITVAAVLMVGRGGAQ